METPLLNTPKKGLKAMNDPVYDGPRIADAANWTAFGAMEMFLLGPLRAIGGLFSMTALFAMVLVFLGTFIYGFVFIFAQFNAITAGTDTFIRSFLLGLVAASLLYVTSLWTYWDDLPTIIYPAHSFSMIGTTLTKHRPYTFGLAQAIMYGIFQFGGFAASGGMLKALGVTSGILPTNTLLNVAATNVNTYWMYWFGSTIICFSFLYNRLFKQEGETPLQTAHRTALTTALAVFVITVAFFSLGLNTYSCGVYTAQAIVAGGVYPTPFVGDTVNQWAFYVFVDMLAVPATVFVLVVLFVLLLQGIEYVGEMLPRPRQYSAYDPAEPQYAKENVASAASVGSSMNHSSSSRLKQRTGNLKVDY